MEEMVDRSRIPFDPSWRGPLRKERTITDIYWLVALACFLFLWFSIAIYASALGGVDNLTPSIDSEGLRCGMDPGVENRPYLLILDNNGTYSSICVEKCPVYNFLYKKNNENMSIILPKLICKVGINVGSINTSFVLDTLMKERRCARLYLRSKPQGNRCVPDDINLPSDFYKVLFNDTAADIEKFLSSQVINKDYFQIHILKGLSSCLYKALLCIVITIGLCHVYFIIMRWLTLFCSYSTIFLLCTSLFYLISQSAIIYSSDIRKTSAMITIVISAMAMTFIILFAIFARSKISQAAGILKQSCKTIYHLRYTLIFPLISYLLCAIIVVIGLTTAFQLSTIKDPVFRVTMMEDKCHCPKDLHYNDGETCDPTIFLNQCKTMRNETCYLSKCSYSSSVTTGKIQFLHFINGFCIYWFVLLIFNFNHFVLAGTFAVWCWTYNKAQLPKKVLLNFTKIVVRYHLGSLAMGSLVVIPGRNIYRVVKLFKFNFSSDKLWVIRLSGIIDIMENTLKYLTRYTYIMMAVHGRNFFTSAKDAFNLKMRNVVKVTILSTFTDWLLFFAVLLISGATTMVAWAACDIDLTNYRTDSEESREVLIFLLTTGIGSFIMASMLMAVLKTAMDTISICYMEDTERNDGIEKPFHVPFKLRGLLKR